MKAVGVDGCRAGWFAVILSGERSATAVYSPIRFGGLTYGDSLPEVQEVN